MDLEKTYHYHAVTLGAPTVAFITTTLMTVKEQDGIFSARLCFLCFFFFFHLYFSINYLFNFFPFQHHGSNFFISLSLQVSIVARLDFSPAFVQCSLFVLIFSSSLSISLGGWVSPSYRGTMPYISSMF